MEPDNSDTLTVDIPPLNEQVTPYERFILWMRQRDEQGRPAHNGIPARIGDHTGFLSTQVTTAPDGTETTRTFVRSKTKRRNQYRPIFPRHLDGSGTPLEVKYGSRYEPWRPEW